MDIEFEIFVYQLKRVHRSRRVIWFDWFAEQHFVWWSMILTLLYSTNICVLRMWVCHVQCLCSHSHHIVRCNHTYSCVCHCSDVKYSQSAHVGCDTVYLHNVCTICFNKFNEFWYQQETVVRITHSRFT